MTLLDKLVERAVLALCRQLHRRGSCAICQVLGSLRVDAAPSEGQAMAVAERAKLSPWRVVFEWRGRGRRADVAVTIIAKSNDAATDEANR